MEQTYRVEFICGECCESYQTISMAQACCGDIAQVVYVCNECEEEFDVRPESAEGLKECCARMVPKPKPEPVKPKEPPRPKRPKGGFAIDRILRREEKLPPAPPPAEQLAKFVVIAQQPVMVVTPPKDPDPNCPDCRIARENGNVIHCHCMK